MLTSNAVIGTCCTAQTEKPEDPYYISPCCISEWHANRRIPLKQGHVIGRNTFMFRNKSPRPV